MANKPGSRLRLFGVKAKPTGNKMEHRTQSRREYHSNRWTVLSRKFRDANPLCVHCQKAGIVQPSEVTDHIIPVEIHTNFWDRSNWQALCKKCNIVKGNSDKQIINEHRKANK